MPGTLFVVATPIGNLEDVTLRALRILKSVSLIAAEDTRRTATLLRHYDIRTPTTSFHEHNERQKLASLLARLRSGDDVAIVSDAGTPGISDPGYRLVRAAIEENITVQAVPGPSAVLTALVSSGLPTDSFTFMGFAPARSSARKSWLAEVAREQRTVVFFDSPRRVRDTLKDLAEVAANRQVAVARELTKLHEELVNRPIHEVVAALPPALKGEITVVLGPVEQMGDSREEPSDQEIWSEFCDMTKNGGRNRRQAIREISKKHSMSARAVYSAVERAKK